MEKVIRVNHELLDAEWVSMIMQARSMGLNIADVRSMLYELQQSNHSVQCVEEKVV